MVENKSKLLVIRNDKLGDFMLIFPALALLKKAMSNLEITALVPAYTAPMAELCPYIDKVIVDVNPQDSSAVRGLLNTIKQEKFSAVINFYLNWHNAKLSFFSGIKQRFAPATKIFQFLCNQRITQRRSKSLKSEYEYNLDLAKAFLHSQNIAIPTVTPPYLSFTPEQIQAQKLKLQQQVGIKPEAKLVFLHCGTGGSAKPLTLEQNAEIIRGLLADFEVQVVLTAGSKAERNLAEELAKQIADPNKVKLYIRNDGLADFALSIACADLFISAPTGPLHIAGALNIPTVAFYPVRRSARALRWQTTNSEDRKLMLSAPDTGNPAKSMDIDLIDITQVLIEIKAFAKAYLTNN